MSYQEVSLQEQNHQMEMGGDMTRVGPGTAATVALTSPQAGLDPATGGQDSPIPSQASYEGQSAANGEAIGSTEPVDGAGDDSEDSENGVGDDGEGADDGAGDRTVSVIAFVEGWLADNQASWDPADSMIHALGGKLGRADVLALLDRSKLEAVAAGVPIKFSRRDMDTCVQTWILAQKQAHRAAFVAKFDHYTPNDAVFARFVRAATGADSPLLARVLKQFVWQMKKKMFYPDYAIRFSIAPFFYSEKRGSGKSVGVDHLLSPLKPYYRQMKAESLESDASKPIYSNNLAILVDDIEIKSIRNIGPIKNLITTDAVSNRRYFTHDVETRPKTVSLCFTSNRCVDEIFGDEGATRRFVQFHWMEVMGSEVLPEILAINPMDFYHAVDHRAEIGPIDDPDIIRQLEIYQSGFQQLDDAQRFFLRHVHPECGALKNRTRMSKSELREIFETQSARNKKYNSRRFYEQITDLSKRMGFKEDKARHSYAFYYSQDADFTRMDQYQERKMIDGLAIQRIQ